MRDSSYQLWPAAEAAEPPFSYFPVMARDVNLWRVRQNDGRVIGQARTRAGARAAVRALYSRREAGA